MSKVRAQGFGSPLFLTDFPKAAQAWYAWRVRFLFSTGSLHTYGIARCFAIAAQPGGAGTKLMTCAAGKTTRTKAVRRSCVKHARSCAINQLDLFEYAEI